MGKRKRTNEGNAKKKKENEPKRKRNYRSGYTSDYFKEALEAINKGMSQREAARKFKVPRATLGDKVKGRHPKQPGGQFRLCKETEEAITMMIRELVNWRVPLRILDLQLLIRNYLDRCEVDDAVFTDNTPSDDWVRRFIDRNKLTVRYADNVKPERCILSSAVVDFFEKLEDEIGDVPPENIFNFDETNFQDNPAKRKVIAPSGLRRVERKKTTSKQSISIMFSGNATGRFLPPMAVYKATHVWENWIKEGPDGMEYGATKKGWFNERTFLYWLKEIFVKNTKDLPRPVVLIGDNLGCHFTKEVLEVCRKEDIKLIPLVGNATHLLQPLDFAVFKQLKQVWHKAVDKWRKESRSTKNIPKCQYPRLLKEIMAAVHKDYGKSLVNGFRTCGLYPLNRNEVLSKLPKEGRNNRDPGGENAKVFLNEACLAHLKEAHPIPKEQEQEPRGKKIVKHPGVDIVKSNAPLPEAASWLWGSAASSTPAPSATTVSSSRNDSEMYGAGEGTSGGQGNKSWSRSDSDSSEFKTDTESDFSEDEFDAEEEYADNEDEIWNCDTCKQDHVYDRHRWIECEQCKRKFHL